MPRTAVMEVRTSWLVFARNSVVMRAASSSCPNTTLSTQAPSCTAAIRWLLAKLSDSLSNWV